MVRKKLHLLKETQVNGKEKALSFLFKNGMMIPVGWRRTEERGTKSLEPNLTQAQFFIFKVKNLVITNKILKIICFAIGPLQ